MEERVRKMLQSPSLTQKFPRLPFLPENLHSYKRQGTVLLDATLGGQVFFWGFLRPTERLVTPGFPYALVLVALCAILSLLMGDTKTL